MMKFGLFTAGNAAVRSVQGKRIFSRAGSTIRADCGSVAVSPSSGRRCTPTSRQRRASSSVPPDPEAISTTCSGVRCGASRRAMSACAFATVKTSRQRARAASAMSVVRWCRGTKPSPRSRVISMPPRWRSGSRRSGVRLKRVTSTPSFTSTAAAAVPPAPAPMTVTWPALIMSLRFYIGNRVSYKGLPSAQNLEDNARKVSNRDPRSPMGNVDSSVIRSVRKALRLLDAFGGDHLDFGLTELSDHLGYPKSVTHKLVRTLMEGGFLEQDAPTRRYHIGPGILTVAGAYLRCNPLVREGAAVLQDLARATEHTAALGVLDRGEGLYVAAVEGTRAVKASAHVGDRRPL